MNSTANRTAAALAAAAAITAGTYAVSAASAPARPDHCAVAIKHADRMAHLQPQMNVTQGLLGIAMTDGNRTEARAHRADLQRLQSDYFAVQADYLAAAQGCR